MSTMDFSLGKPSGCPEHYPVDSRFCVNCHPILALAPPSITTSTSALPSEYLTERERTLHRELVAAKRELSVATARGELRGAIHLRAFANATTYEERAEACRLLMNCGAISAANANDIMKPYTPRPTVDVGEDFGAGIARMPETRRDNSVAWLDEDLLCEDE